MTFEEIQKTIEGMLAVQRQLQESQMQLHESQLELRERQLQFQDAQERERETLQIMIEEMNQFIERSNRNERRIEQLIGYSITNESARRPVPRFPWNQHAPQEEHLDIEQRFRNLEARLSEIESQN
ncbi:MAG: hypothetical protein AAGF26_15085 [Cyanobacteria bacterium P01_G01_bin.49]